MQKKSKLVYLICALSSILVHCASTEVEEARQPSSIPPLNGVPEKLKVTGYMSEPKVIDGYLITMHFIKSDQETWYFTFGCSKNEEKKHSFEIYFKPYAKPSDLDQKINTSYLKGSQSFDKREDCEQAFSKLIQAKNKSVCLVNEANGFLVSECQESTLRRYRDMRERL